MPRSGPISLALPAFEGTTRKLILLNVGAFFGLLILRWLAPQLEAVLHSHLILEPLAVAHGEIWQLLTYSFVEQGILGILFGMLTLWFTGSLLEPSFGGRWLAELYLTSVIGGAILASAISFTHILGLRPDVGAAGAWSGIFGLMVAIAMIFGDQEFLLWFVLRIKAKYMVAIYILIAVALLLKQADTFNALIQLSGALCGALFVKFAPRRGLAFGLSEQYFGVRNRYYRWKRRRAARKFEVYMRKQNREVHFDKDGRYVDPDELRKNPNDKRWMN
ncbi:rhomboid family intramembrane serine protease [Tunturiibacter gelidoferens]|jgi:membrane associated rhomboid family serine protease|uniref:Membrane associated rhomboid family serine protease n=1 Tax=Tunturiibacter gelidiferens TaxID=3069689 RepID=A0A9X0QC52_9BACT|nr:rhomboid family intramembrane serine protease [Edaphobacter lichenicola]MBB5327662.1 membrane associated rhomboid family serine protease [Edaphobacter lichenicola]